MTSRAGEAGRAGSEAALFLDFRSLFSPAPSPCPLRRLLLAARPPGATRRRRNVNKRRGRVNERARGGGAEAHGRRRAALFRAAE